MRSPFSTMLVPAVLVLAVAACSSGGSDGATSATSLATSANSTIPATAATAGASSTSIVPKRPATDPLCVTAKKIFDLDQQYSAAFAAALKKVTESTDPSSFQPAMKELQSQGEFTSLLAAYDQLAKAVPAANRPQVVILRDYTSRLFEQVLAMPSVPDLKDYIDSLQSSSDTITAGKAALALDNLTYAECGQHMSSG